ncbi:hypothetical protein [[Mycoplasma] gypis]|uniref:DUF31 domain-containing protein n=1 Tax=[Mycoplasma] gypis TaxID=92404 RepID=A0ABZ2RTQ1_9BACT|nr:hypothetical protein [[Mycoplasma] gypis]MBN0919642.1 hypothetical protein [[Mycoplasma] gypis]
MNKTVTTIDDVFSDPISQFYEKAIKRSQELFKIFIQDRLKQYNENIENEAIVANKNIQNLYVEISKLKKHLKISLRTFWNGVIIFFCFLIIGLAFLKLYFNNKKIINDFERQKNNLLSQINEITVKKNAKLSHAFNNFSLSDIRRYVLKEMGISRVNDYDFTDVNISVIKDARNPIFIECIDKYDIRNNYFYDISYRKLTYEPISYTGAKVFAYSYDGKKYTKTVTATYEHISPFLRKRSLFLYPTNYLPELRFRARLPIDEKTFKHKVKKNDFLLENTNFYKYYNLDFNDKIPFMNFFQLITQNNYVKWAEYAQPKNIFNWVFEKKQNGFLIFNDSIAIKNSYQAQNDTLQKWINEEYSDAKTISKHIWNEFYPHIETLLANLTFIFLNKYLASEKYTKPGERFQYQYQDDGVYQGEFQSWDSNILLNVKIHSNNYFQMVTKKPAIDFVHEIKQSFSVGDAFIYNIISNNWWAKEEVKLVTQYDPDVGNVVIPVKYINYIKYNEAKNLIFKPSAKLKPNQLIRSLILSAKKPISTGFEQDSAIENIVRNNKIYYNYEISSDFEGLNEKLEFVDSFNKRFAKYIQFYTVEIDQNGMYIFISEPNKIPNEIKTQMALF